MSSVSNYAGNVAAYSSSVNQASAEENTSSAKKTKVRGKTVGNPELSEKGAKYYEELKKKYSNMDFVLVSRDQKEFAKAQAGSFANPGKMVVLIDEDKIEKMAEDENYRKQYEGIIAKAASGISQLGSSLANTGANVKSYGMKINDNGTATLFAVLKKGTSDQKARIEKKAAEKKEAKKAEARKAKKEEREERLEKSRDGKDKGKIPEEDTVTIYASSVEELIKKVGDYMQSSRVDSVQTEEEKLVGQNFNFSV
ncbi:MAG: hypothetical protein K2K09_00525 [Lachnospiraceae bacterium]|nr:hypothetical protein [Lachnospiraceae bacterium]